MQLVPFDTWSRMVGQVLKSSLLDHIYVDNVKLIKNVKCKIMPFGDHVLILADLCMTRPVQKKSLKRFWKGYSKNSLCNNLGLVDWTNNAETVQDIWNDFETKLIRVIDSVVPLHETSNE